MRIQDAQTAGLHTASAGCSMGKLYESMSHKTLNDDAKALGSPRTLVALATSAYRMSRSTTYNHHATDPLYATQGVITGECRSIAL